MSTRPRFPEDAVLKSVGALGIEVLEERDDELVAHCPRHRERTGKEDRHPSWSINTETGQHFCFSCHYKGNLYTLNLDLRGRAYANRFWQEYEEKGFPVPEGYSVDRNPVMPGAVVREEPWIPESELILFDDPPVWALGERRITAESAAHYGVRWAEESRSWILPLRDPATDRLIGYQRKAQGSGPVINYPTGMRKGTTLFGYRQAVPEHRTVLVESPLDAVLLHVLGFPAVALCGSRITDDQIGLLQGFDHVVLALDNDTAGTNETARIRRMMPGFRYAVMKYPHPDYKDVGEMEIVDIGEAVLDAGL